MTVSLSVAKLKILTVAYLALPVLLFFITYLKPIFAIVCCGLYLYSFYHFYKKNISNKVKIDIPLWQIMSCAVLLFVWVFISGSGGMGLMSHDHTKSSAIYKDIVENSLPVSYQYNGKTIYLATYLGYYLPMPILFGWLKWKFLMLAVALWTYLGVSLGMFWFCKLVNSFSPFVILFFIFVSGWDIAGLIHGIGFNGSFNLLIKEFYEHQPFFAIMIDKKMMLLYQSNTQTLFWSPQHAIASWIASGLFFYEFIYENDNKNSAIYLALLPFWSPFMLVGLLPFYLYSATKQGIKKYFIGSNFVLIPITLITLWFVNSIPIGNVDKGFLFYKPERLLGYFDEFETYLFFIFFEVLIWAIPIYLIFKKYAEKKWVNLFLFSILVLLIIPFYKLGKFNDWSQRVSMPALFLLWVMVARSYFLAKKNIIYKIILGVILVIGCWDPLYFVLLSLKVTKYKIICTAPDIKKVPNYVQTSIQQKWPIYHSFAPDSASFFKYMVR